MSGETDHAREALSECRNSRALACWALRQLEWREGNTKSAKSVNEPTPARGPG